MIPFISTFLLIIFTLTVAPVLIAWTTAIFGALSKSIMVDKLGTRSQVYIGGLGTFIHELGHVIGLKVFHQKIDRFKLIQFRHLDWSDSLGYVYHNCNPLSIFQLIGNYFSGIAPFYACLFSLWLAHRLLLGRAVYSQINSFKVNVIISSGVTNLVENIRADLSQPLMLLIFILFIVAISTTGFSLSWADNKTTATGFIPYVIAIFPVVFIMDVADYVQGFNIDFRMINLLEFMIMLMLTAITYVLISIIVVSVISHFLKSSEAPISEIRHKHIRHMFQHISDLIHPKGRHFKPNKVQMFIHNKI